MAGLVDQLRQAKFRNLVLAALVVAFAVASASTFTLIRQQAAGADFSCFWAGAKTALTAPARLYDFNYISALQGWPLGPGSIRPYIYPPSALPIFIPFAVAPYWLSYGLWVLATGGLFFWAGRKAGAPLWWALLPSFAFVAYCGQVTFLIGGLVTTGLALRERRILAGVLFGIAAAIKPQILVLLPFALLGDRAWKTIFATGATGAALCLLSVAIWGLQPWLDWAPALGRFQHLIASTPSLVEDSITPYAWLSLHGLNGAWVFLLAPLAAVLAWLTFRRSLSIADRLIVLLGGALLISPYAMNYELALLAPALAIYLARTGDRAWPIYVAASIVCIASWPLGGLLAILALPVARMLGERRAWSPIGAGLSAPRA